MLTERRKADRAKMAEQVRALAAVYGIDATVAPYPYPESYPQRLDVTIRTDRGLCLTVDFDGESTQPDVHVLAWHMATDVDTCLSDAFGNINPHHFRKLTCSAVGLDNLLTLLARQFELIQSGAAYSPEREAASIAKAGETAAERNARMKAYFDAERAAA